MQESQAVPLFRYWGPDAIAYGPVELPEFVSWIKHGRVTADTWVFLDHQGEWRRAREIEELKMFFRDRTDGESGPTPPGIHPENLRRIKYFSEMEPEQLTSLLHYLELVSLPKFAVLFKEGDPADALYSILDGEMRVRKIIDGRETTLFTLGPGESFGETALLSEKPRVADVVANEDTSLLKLPAEVFRRLTREAPALATPFLIAISRTITARALDLGRRFEEAVRLGTGAGVV